MSDPNALVEKELAVGGSKDLLLSIEIDKQLNLKATAQYPLLHAVDAIKSHLPAWMQSALNGLEQKYAPQPEQSPVQEGV